MSLGLGSGWCSPWSTDRRLKDEGGRRTADGALDMAWHGMAALPNEPPNAARHHDSGHSRVDVPSDCSGNETRQSTVIGANGIGTERRVRMILHFTYTHMHASDT
jgi:hypothetical protein